MSEFKLCENGHYYPQALNDCPYCPKSASGFSQQMIGENTSGGLDKTKMTDNNQQIPSLFGGGGVGSGGNLSRTQVFTGGNDIDFGGSSFGNNSPFKPQQQSTGRKLVGWLVSFTIDPNGIDYKLYEGRNLLGSDAGCDIPIINDPAVSGKHLTILHRMGHFKFKDELSTNGTFINDVFEEEGNLKDGDVVRMGDTIFKFRSIA